MKRSAFALLEALLVVGIVGVVATFSVPLYSQWQLQNDLQVAKTQIIEGLQRAKLNAQAGKGGTSWSFYVPEGDLFPGSDYATAKADPNVWGQAEVFPMPSSVKSYGITKVTYDRNGNPDTTGTITLAGFNNQITTIQVVLEVSQSTVDTTVGSSLTICYQGTTMTVTYASWPDWQAKGATQNGCPGSSTSSSVSSSASSAVSSSSSVSSAASSSSVSSASSAASSASSASSVASSSSSAGATGGTGGVGGASSSSSSSVANNCPSKFTVANGVLTTTATTNITFTNLAALITYGAGGPSIPVNDCYSTDNGSSYKNMFGNNGNCPLSANAWGTAVNVNGGETKALTSVATGTKLALLARGRYQTQGWLAFDQYFDSKDDVHQVVLMKNGDTPIANAGFGNQTSLKALLQSKGLISAQGKVNIGACELIMATELGTDYTSSTADFQDSVVRVTVQ